MEYRGVSFGCFVHARDCAGSAGDPARAFLGSGQYVLSDTGQQLGPYADATPPHSFAPSSYQRSSDLCGTCHDVSNPLVGDLAPNNGAMTPLAPGSL